MLNSQGVYLLDQTLSGYVSAKTDETVNGGPYYYLFVRPDGAWYLMRRSFSAGIETAEYIRGQAFAGVVAFNNRASQSGWDTYDKIF